MAVTTQTALDVEVDPSYAVFRELNEHLRSTEMKHLQVSIAYLGTVGIALSFLAPDREAGIALLHTWGHVIAYYTLGITGCTTLFVQHIFRGWKKEYLLSVKKIAATWPLDEALVVPWLRRDVGPYAPKVRHVNPMHPVIRMSGENGLFYFTMWVTSSLVALLLISISNVMPSAWRWVVIGVVGGGYALFVSQLWAAGVVRRRRLEADWKDFGVELRIREHGAVKITDPRPFARPLDRDLVILDLHNHTHHSYDSSNHATDYERARETGRVDIVAITDHNTIEGALELLNCHVPIIVGEEVDTADGELVGLFLRAPLPIGVSAVETAQAIRAQGGLVYLQHPFFRFKRRRLSRSVIDDLARLRLVDIVEVVNGGVLMRGANRRAGNWAKKHSIPEAAGSDAHHPLDIGRCRVVIKASEWPDQLDLATLDGGAQSARLLSMLTDATIRDEHRSSAASYGSRVAYACRNTMSLLGGVARKTRAPRTEV
jgi:predicted metal-dependent phosphoesterase TrpH